jgi:hypothetical protein
MTLLALMRIARRRTLSASLLHWIVLTWTIQVRYLPITLLLCSWRLLAVRME